MDRVGLRCRKENLAVSPFLCPSSRSMAKEEVEEALIEVEAVQAVYGDDCLLLSQFPPHLHLHIKPRTADVSSEQFVEAVLEIQAGPQYPVEAPHICIVESKGLDEERQKHLVTSVQEKAHELSSSSMLVALCEDAVEKLSIMNRPDGDCPMCLYPLVPNDAQDNTLPFMKLMSCFHCFHSECIVRWFNWLQGEVDVNCGNSTVATTHTSGERENLPGISGLMKGGRGYCPLCRKVFHAKDIEHVLNLVGPLSKMDSPQIQSEVVDDKNLFESDLEILRRRKFEAALRLQEENGGLIEHKRNEVIRPGMFISQSNIPPGLPEECNEQQERDPKVTSETNSQGSSNKPSASEHAKSRTRLRKECNPHQQRGPKVPSKTNSRASSNKASTSDGKSHMRLPEECNEQQQRGPKVTSEGNSCCSSKKASSNEHRKSQTRRHGVQNLRSSGQWVKKENNTAG